METICRLCLEENPEKLICLLDNNSLIEKIKNCVSIEISGEGKFPANICTSCKKKVEDWYEFKNACLNANMILSEKINNEKNKVTCTIVTEDDYQVKMHCDFCYKEFTKSEPGSELIARCNNCSEVLSTALKYVDDSKVTCHLCGVTILKASTYQHLIRHTDRFKCPYSNCSTRCSSKTSYEAHIASVHLKKRDLICTDCGKAFPTKSLLNVHSKTHSLERPYKCELCEYDGKTASALYTHMASHSDQKFICDVCSKIFRSVRHLNSHMKTVHLAQKSKVCDYCGKTFTKKSKLDLHIRKHTGLKPHGCQLCGKNFSRSDALKEHVAIHGDRVSCGGCGKYFTTKKGLSRHKCSVE